jgi:hypothetical protein
MKKLSFISFILLVILATYSCSTTGNKDKTIDELITHFNKNEIIGEKNTKAFALIGAIDGCSYNSEEFSIEIYKFSEPDRIWENLPYKNGNFGMLIHSPTEGKLNKKLIDVFNRF